jgi:prefoldin subunit 5
LQSKKIGFESAGDILIAKVNKTKSVILAVDVGNGYLITATISNGISVINKNYYTILKVFTNGH